MLSLNKPIAVKANLVPVAIVRPAGVTVMDTTVALVTSSVVEPLMESSVAVMVVVPGVRALAKPRRPIVATAVSEEVHETCPVIL